MSRVVVVVVAVLLGQMGIPAVVKGELVALKL
jgi:hypothetical protein